MPLNLKESIEHRWMMVQDSTYGNSSKLHGMDDSSGVQTICGYDCGAANGFYVHPDRPWRKPVVCDTCRSMEPASYYDFLDAVQTRWENERAVIEKLRQDILTRVSQASSRSVMSLARTLGVVEHDPFWLC